MSTYTIEISELDTGGQFARPNERWNASIYWADTRMNALDYQRFPTEEKAKAWADLFRGV